MHTTFVFKHSSGDLVLICAENVQKAKDLLELNDTRAKEFKLYHSVSPYNPVGNIYYSDLNKVS